VSFIKTKLFNR